jgi:hypothetical protein
MLRCEERGVADVTIDVSRLTRVTPVKTRAVATSEH